MSEQSFASLIQGVRAGDEAAISELVDRYGSHIQRVARVRMQGSQLRQLMESVDICQSVLANFCEKAAAGQFEIETPQQLLALLSVMTRNQLLKKVAFHNSHTRDIRRPSDPGDGLGAVPNNHTSPSLQVSERDMVGRVRHLLTEDERFLLEQRAEGRSWVEIASTLGVAADRIRKQASRAAERVACHMQGVAAMDSKHLNP